MPRAVPYVLFFVLLALSSDIVSAQVKPGTPQFGSFGGGPDVINLANLNSHLTIPVIHKPGRGTNFYYDLTYDSSVWYPVTVGSTTSWQPVGNWGWASNSAFNSGSSGYLTYFLRVTYCYDPIYHSEITGEQDYYTNAVYYDPWGTGHSFDAYTLVQQGSCGSLYENTFPSTAKDGSGLVASSFLGPITTSGGVVLNPPVNPTGGSYTSTVKDRNGNQMTANTGGTFTDTLNTTALTISGSIPNPVSFTYTAPSGAPASVRMNYTQYTVRTWFQAGIAEYGPTSVSLVSSIVLPDNSQYSFTYEPTPAGAGCTGCVTARIASVTLPTGGQISYSYSGSYNGIFPDGSAATLTRTTPDGAWTYAQVKGTGAASTTTISDPQNNQTVIQFQGINETQRQVYQGSTSGTLLQTINTCYNGATSPCTGTAVSLPISRRTEIIQLGSSGQQCKHDYFYNNSGLQTQADDYDYGPSIGPLIRRVLTTYAPLGNNIVDMPDTVTVQNGSLAPKAQTSYIYDEPQFPITTTTGTPQLVAISGSRGNVTTVKSYKDATTYLTKNFTYFDTGNVKTATDVNSAVTTYNYQDVPSTCGNSFPTSVSEPLSMSRSFAWNCTGGVQTQVTDENGKVTTTTYNDAYFWRPAQQDFPDGGQIKWTYNSPTSTTITTKLTGTQNLVNTVLLDSLGRTSETQINSDPQGIIRTVTTYDALGRVASVSNPYRTISDPTYGRTSDVYDALNRVCVIIPPDGTAVSGSTCPAAQPANDIFVTYSGNNSTVTDQAGKKRQSTIDGLGRIAQVTEDPGGLGYVTTYGYDALSNLTSVLQNSSRQRTFAYDWLSRPTSAYNPESGTATYGYDASPSIGDLTSRVAPAPNQTGSATVTTTYSYDLLHRLKQKSYSDTTPTAKFLYDVAPTGWTGVTFTNIIGRMTEAYIDGTPNPQSASVYSYDAVGRVTTNGHCAPANCGTGAWNLSYGYDLAGNLTSYTFGTASVFTQSIDTVGRVTSLTFSPADPQHPANVATVDTALGFFPHGAPRKITLGNGLTETAMYNSRLQPCRVNVNSTGAYLSTCTDGTPAGNVLDQSYGYNVGTNNGSVSSWSATGNQSFSRTFTYDPLNRLATMNQSSGYAPQFCAGAFGLSWNYDAWGNRTDQNVTAGACGSLHAIVNANNQFVGPPYQYDAAGNMTRDALHSYRYDAENRLLQTDGATTGDCGTGCYSYDAFGRRVEERDASTKIDQVYDLEGKVVSEWCFPCGTFTGQLDTYIYLNGALEAEFTNSTTYFIHRDHLGSTRLATQLNQVPAQNLDYLAFGEQNFSDTRVTSHEFTSQEHDGESNLEHFLFRKYSSTLGRWMTPDPLGLAASDLSDPRSLNLYAYVTNSPVDLVDPLGLIQNVPTGCKVIYPTPGGPGQLICPGGGGGGSGGSGDADTCDDTRNKTGCISGGGDGSPANDRKPCTNAPKSPRGESATANLNQVKQTTQSMWPATKLAYFNLVFRTGGTFDYKTTYGGAGWGNPDQFVDYGNWNFGYVCGANYPSFFCQSMAGGARMWRAANQRKNPFGSGFPFVKPPYGDQAVDNQQIRNGIQAQASGCVQ